jgi:benzoylformate decarboxylase
MHDHLPMTEPDTFFTCASGGLGHGLPAAVGVSMAKPGVRTIAVLGDGSSMYSIQGLWTAAQLKLPLTVIIVRNGSYDALTEFGRHFDLSPLPGLELPQMDFVALAQGHGLPAIRVSQAADLDEALKNGLTADGPILLEVAVERH